MRELGMTKHSGTELDHFGDGWGFYLAYVAILALFWGGGLYVVVRFVKWAWTN